MKEFRISQGAEGQKLIRFLTRILPNAGTGFLYRMLRKKNITVNGRKAAGNEVLSCGDTVRIFFSDETFRKMAGGEVHVSLPAESAFSPEILYEDADLLAVNKPAGMLSQRDSSGRASINELLIGWMLETNRCTEEDLYAFHPSVVNRLDTNTSGVLLFGKTVQGLQYGADLMRSHDGKKTYHAIVRGHADFPDHTVLSGYLQWNERERRMTYYRTPSGLRDAQEMEEEVTVEKAGPCLSFLRIVLYTGRKHQIRASLAAYGLPVLGDRKYGCRGPGIPERQLFLHALSLEVRPGIIVTAPSPQIFMDVMEREN